MSARPRGGLKPDQFFFQGYKPGTGKMTNLKIIFEAHIVGLTDTSNPSWNENFDMGRADPTMTYGSMHRSINVSYIVVAVNSIDADEHEANYNKLSQLGTLTYPIYKSRLGYNAPHVFFQIGDLLSGIGVLSSLDYNWTPDTPWIEDKQQKLRPLFTEVNMGINVLTDAKGNRPEFGDGDYKYFGV